MYLSPTSTRSTMNTFKNPLSKSRNFVSLETEASQSSNLVPTLRSSLNRLEKPSNRSPLKVQFLDTLPAYSSTEDRLRTSSISPRSNISKSRFDKLTLGNYSEPQNPLAETRSKRSSELFEKLESGSQSTRANGSRELKQSSSYINAMKALQNKVKSLEEQLKKEKHELEVKYYKEMDLVKEQMRHLEEELRQKEKTIHGINEENERLRSIGIEIESEIQRTLHDKKRLQEKYKDLEGKFQERLMEAEEAKSRSLQMQFMLQEKDAEIADLREKVGCVEKEKLNINLGFEQKLKDLVVKNKQAEEKRKELEDELHEDARRRFQKDNEVEKEINKLRAHIRKLEDVNIQQERIIKEKDEEIGEKMIRISKQKEEMNLLAKEIHSAKIVNERTQLYAQDMAQANQRLITSMSEKGKSGKQVSYDLEEPQESSRGNYSSRRHERVDSQVRSPDSRVYRSPKSPDASLGVRSNPLHTKVWSVGSPQVRSEAVRNGSRDSAIGPKLSGDDLQGNEGKEQIEERRSPKMPLSRSRNGSATNLAKRGVSEGTTSGKKRSGRKETKEEAMDRLELERVIKEIIEVQKEMLEWNKQYQRLSNSLANLERDSGEYQDKKRRMEDIGAKIQERSAYLIQLKQTEEQLNNRIKY